MLDSFQVASVHETSNLGSSQLTIVLTFSCSNETTCQSLKCTCKWPSMPYAGLSCLLGNNLNVHAIPEKLQPTRDTTDSEVHHLNVNTKNPFLCKNMNELVHKISCCM